MVIFALLLSNVIIPLTAAASNECIDSIKKFRIKNRGLKRRRCKGWKASGFCGKNKVDRLCPVTCGTCPCKDIIGQFPYNNNMKKCDWVSSSNTEYRCKKRPIMANCPETCGMCESPLVKGPGPGVSCPTNKSFSITLMNMGKNSKYDDEFASAKSRWESIIKCDLPDIGAQPEDFDWFGGKFGEKTYRGPVDDVVIGFNLDVIDGPSNILGSAGATYIRHELSSPISGIMVFDSADFDNMSKNDAEIIILHEMGHVLGLVNNYPGRCHSPCDTSNYQYGWKSNCTLASHEYDKLNLGTGHLKVEDGNEGGECGHWEEDNFPKSLGSSELMTGTFESGSAQLITRVTIAALDEAYEDYVVDYSAADAFPFSASSAGARIESKSKVHFPDIDFNTNGNMDQPPPTIQFVGSP